jgi:glycosyltransferase involved in cell wall biosynthesis
MITYNQEKYIEQAVISALLQQTSFDYEIVIGEDCSTDQTRNILIELQQRHPDKVRLLLHRQNVGMQHNFGQTLNACQGMYIAYLEGDDYWTSSDKLQKQVDFLDQHPDFAICFHNAIQFDDDDSKPATLICSDDQPTVSTIEDILRRNFLPACSIMFRNHLFGELPDWFFGLKLGDWPLHILNAQHGKIGYINEVMAAYRLHGTGVWSTLAPDRIIAYTSEMFRHVDAHFGYKYHQIIEQAIGDFYIHWAWQVITGPLSVEGAQMILELASRIGPDAPARLLKALADRAADLDRSKAWLTQQRDNWQAEAARHRQYSSEQQGWIEQQRARWQAATQSDQQLIAELTEWNRQILEAKAYLEQQVENWQRAVQQEQQLVKELQIRNQELEKRQLLTNTVKHLKT